MEKDQGDVLVKPSYEYYMELSKDPNISSARRFDLEQLAQLYTPEELAKEAAYFASLDRVYAAIEQARKEPEIKGTSNIAARWDYPDVLVDFGKFIRLMKGEISMPVSERIKIEWRLTAANILPNDDVATVEAYLKSQGTPMPDKITDISKGKSSITR